MEIRVGIIEDEKIFNEYLKELINRWAKSVNCEISYKEYCHGKKMLLQPEINYDIIFIDIQLEDINGVEVAKKLREKKYRGEIVFITAFKEYVFEGYEVNALNYILKPASQEKVIVCMNSVFKNIQNENYILKNRDVIEKIPYSQIFYILSNRHHMELVTADKEYRHLISIKNIMKILPIQFVQCHRTIIVNINHIKKLKGHSIIMSNDMCLPVSNTYIQGVRQSLERNVL